MPFEIEMFQAYVERFKEAKEFEAKAKKLRAENNAVEETLIENMIDSGMKYFNVGDKRVGISITLWASALDVVDEFTGEVMGKDWPYAIQALRDAGYGDMAEEKVHAGKLSSLIRELRKSEDGVPEELENALKISEVPKLKITAAK